jgi:hypothetical protein
LEEGWSYPDKGNTSHLFDIKAVLLSILNNIWLLPEKFLNFIIGRQTGLLLYFPLIILMLAVAFIYRNKGSLLILLGFASYLLLNWLTFPTNGFGGGGSYGSRYLMQALPVVFLSFLFYRKKINSKVVSFFSRLVLIVSVVFQYSIYPVTQNTVQNPTKYLTQLPALLMPLEDSILPSIPIYNVNFFQESKDLVLYRTKGFDINSGILDADNHQSAEVVIYKRNRSLQNAEIIVQSLLPTNFKIYNDNKIIFSGDTDNINGQSYVNLPEKIFGRECFDLLTLSHISWGVLKFEFEHIEKREKVPSLVQVHFAGKINQDTTVIFDHSITPNDFKNNGISKGMGWSHNENWGVWSDSVYAEICIAMGKPNNAVVEFSMQAYTPPESPFKTMKMFLPDNTQRDFIFDEIESIKIIKIPISKHMVSRDGYLRLRFLLPDAISPHELGRGEDTRKLSVGLRSIKLLKIERDNE